MRILVVDDQADMRELIARLILRARPDDDVMFADDGLDAIERWEVLRPDLVVLDHHMTGVDGVKAADMILDKAPQQPIVLLTADHDPELHKLAMRTGIRATIVKDEILDLPYVIRGLGI